MAYQALYAYFATLQYSLFMLVPFKKAACPRHQLPLSYLCTQYNCICSVRLCSRCLQQHLDWKDFPGQFIGEIFLSEQVQYQVKNMYQRYPFLKNFSDASSEKRMQENYERQRTEIIETISLGLSNQKSAIYSKLSEFNSQHYKTKRILKQLSTKSPQPYLSQIKTQHLLPALLHLSSNKGLEKIRGKVIQAQENSTKYMDFIKKVQIFGFNNKQMLAGLGFKQQNLLKSKLKACFSKWTANNKNIITFDKVRQASNESRKRQGSVKSIKSIQTAQTQRSSPFKKLSVVSAQKRPRPSSNKQN